MVHDIKITNLITKQSLELKDSAPDYVLHSADWDNPLIEPKTYKALNQIGETLSGINIGTRQPIIKGILVPSVPGDYRGMKWSSYYKLLEEEVENMKDTLDSLFSVYQDILIEVNDYSLIARPVAPVLFSTKEKENNEVVCYFTLSLTCFENPFFFKQNTQAVFYEHEKKFHFPWGFPQMVNVASPGFIFSLNKTKKVITVENTGDVAAGLVAKIIVKDKVTNLKLKNISNNKFFGLKGINVNKDDIITIITEEGKEQVSLYRDETKQTEDLVANIIAGSDFFKIQKGTSFLAYETEEHTEDNLSISVSFLELFFNIKEL